ncbi:hypothetical protein FRB98_005479 [Tulasnella sp. 332]|nr:hypothetical protein FRB98_005479 [Tulasnella sp. 332]
MLTSPPKNERINNERAGRKYSVGGTDGAPRSATSNNTYRQHATGYGQAPASFQCSPPTPALIRAARALAATNGKQYAGKPLNAAPSTTAAATATVTTASKAQQMQARALAAQAAHQQRVAAEEAAAAAATASPAEAPQRPSLPDNSSNNSFLFGVEFQGFGGVPFSGSKSQPQSQSQQRYSEIPEQYLDIMDELQVDLSLPLASPRDNSINGGMGGFTSPSAPVDISAFLPPPGPPALVATEATIAASAVPLADWAAELCWALVTVGGQANVLLSSPGRAGKQGATMITTMTPALASFRAFANTTLSATLPSPQCLFIGLYYLTLLPIGGRNNSNNNSSFHPNMAPIFGSLTPADRFRQALYGGAGEGGADDGKVARVAFTLALMLGNKWLEDNTFTTRTWHEVTNLPQREIKTVETAALNIFGFSLSVREPTWAQWLLSLRSYTSSLVAREPIGMLGSPNGRALSRLDTLLRATGALDATASQHGTPEGRHSLYMEDDGDDMVVFPRARSIGGRSSTHSRTASLPVVPAEFGMDMQLDSPLVSVRGRTTSNNYAPVQRPMVQQQRVVQQQQQRIHHAHHSYDDMKHHQIQDASYWTVVDPHQQFERPYYVLHQHPPTHCSYDATTSAQRYSHHDEGMHVRVPLPDDYSMYRGRPQEREVYPSYSWQAVEAEIVAARVRELEAPAARGWPRPSEMDWSTNMWSSASSRANVSTPATSA